MDLGFFTHAAGLAALAVMAVQEILKLRIIPGNFASRYPVPTNILLSVIAATLVVWQGMKSQPLTVWDWLLLMATISVVAAICYNALVSHWTELKEMQN